MNPIQQRKLEQVICTWNLICMGQEVDLSGPNVTCPCHETFEELGCRDCPIANAYGPQGEALEWHKYVACHEPKRRIMEAERVLKKLLCLLPEDHKWAEQQPNWLIEERKLPMPPQTRPFSEDFERRFW